MTCGAAGAVVRLDLSTGGNRSLTGNISALAPLVQLTYVDLYNTGILELLSLYVDAGGQGHALIL